MSRTQIVTLVACAGLLGGAMAPLEAQVLRVRLEEMDTQRPIPGMIVSLVDSVGMRHVPALADALGMVTLRAPAPGRWRVRAERAGYSTWESAPLDLAADEEREVTARVPVQATTLDAVVVRGSTSCERSPTTGERSALLWAEARKALEASELAQQRPREMQVRRYERLLDHFGRVEQERVETEKRRTLRAFRSPTPEELSRRGYVTTQGSEKIYYGPDVTVLLSESFAGDHCFRVVEDERKPGWVGLAFEPHRRRRAPDIAGTIWLEREKAILREVTYRYVNAGEFADYMEAGGRITFRQLRDGQWFVESWEIRAPRHGVLARNVSWRQERPERDTLLGAKIDGGNVLEIEGTEEQQPEVAGAATIEGAVTDSLTGAPLVGVIAELAGTIYSDTTDAQGRFRLSAPLAGRYALTFRHEKLLLARMFDARQELELRAGATTTVALLMPTVASRRARWCPAGPDTPRRAAMTAGLVLDSASGEPIAQATARARFRSGAPMSTGGVTVRGTQTEESVTDGRGWFVWCDLPPQQDVEIEVEAEGYRAWRANARFQPEGLHEQVIRLVRTAPPGTSGAPGPSGPAAPAMITGGAAKPNDGRPAP